ncbi:MAG: histidine phosphatase family protein [Candidatus Thorarchaeota archaeon]
MIGGKSVPANWDNQRWLKSARKLVSRINKEVCLTMLVIRHSHRDDSKDPAKLLMKRLTPLGHQMAAEFGSRLSPIRELELYYSNHPRCIETAEGFLKGFEARGGRGQMKTDIRVLLGPFGSGERIGTEMMAQGGPAFVNQWAKGTLPKETIEPISDFKSRFISETIGRLSDANDGTIQCYVTHDLVLMGAKVALFGLTAAPANWCPFLGGFLGILEGDDILFFDAETTTEYRIGIDSYKQFLTRI